MVEEGEDIRTHIVPLSDLADWAASGQIDVLPLLTLTLWLERNCERLRAAIETAPPPP